jgi:hypothetical protein
MMLLHVIMAGAVLVLGGVCIGLALMEMEENDE